jgi:hypothetical protein
MKCLGLAVVGVSCLSYSAWAQNAPDAKLLRAQNSFVVPREAPQTVPNANDCAPFLPQAVWGSNSARPIGYTCFNSSNGS